MDSLNNVVREIVKANNLLFAGQPVLSRFDLNIVINTDYLMHTQVNPVSIPVQQVYVQQPTPMAEAVYVDAHSSKLGKRITFNSQ